MFGICARFSGVCSFVAILLCGICDSVPVHRLVEQMHVMTGTELFQIMTCLVRNS